MQESQRAGGGLGSGHDPAGGRAGIVLPVDRLRNRHSVDEALLAVYGRRYEDLTQDWGRALVEEHL